MDTVVVEKCATCNTGFTGVGETPYDTCKLDNC